MYQLGITQIYILVMFLIGAQIGCISALCLSVLKYIKNTKNKIAYIAFIVSLAAFLYIATDVILFTQYIKI